MDDGSRPRFVGAITLWNFGTGFWGVSPWFVRFAVRGVADWVNDVFGLASKMRDDCCGDALASVLGLALLMGPVSMAKARGRWCVGGRL